MGRERVISNGPNFSEDKAAVDAIRWYVERKVTERKTVTVTIPEMKRTVFVP